MPDIRNGDVDEPDRRTIIANDIVIDVIANEDGSTYIEFYAYSTGQRVEVSDLHVDWLYDRHPNLRLLAKNEPRMTEVAWVIDPDGEERFIPLDEAEEMGARGEASYCQPVLDGDDDMAPHWHKHENWWHATGCRVCDALEATCPEHLYQIAQEK